MLLTKVCLLGEAAVGKTSLRKRFLGEGFKTNYLVTLGADFAVKDVMIKSKQVRFQIWDLAGQWTFKNLRGMYYRGTSGALLVFDVTRISSMIALTEWIDDLFRHNRKKNVPLVLLGNKADIIDKADNPVEHSVIEEYTKTLEDKSIKVSYFDTSALTGLNVNEAFLKLGELIIGEESQGKT